MKLECKACGNKDSFIAEQEIRMRVLVSSDGEFYNDYGPGYIHGDDWLLNILESKKPHGPYKCLICGDEVYERY